MKRQDLEEKIFDLLHGNLSPEKEEEIIADLEKSGMSREEIESIRSVNNLIESIPSPEPSDRLDRRFYAMLGEEKKRALIGEPEVKTRRSSIVSMLTPGLRVAAGITLFLLGWFSSGKVQMTDLTGEVKQLKETLILTMIQQSSPVERIKAVNMISEFEKVDSPMIESLIEVLNNDSNDNVRLLALDALIRYSYIPEVRESLIASIGNQTSPMIQFRLTEIMIALDEKRAVPEFRKVLQNAGLNYSVRGKINEAVVVLL